MANIRKLAALFEDPELAAAVAEGLALPPGEAKFHWRIPTILLGNVQQALGEKIRALREILPPLEHLCASVAAFLQQGGAQGGQSIQKSLDAILSAHIPRPTAK